ncbi:MAG: L-threonylcarbamoyladenylate synthase, partial [Lysobacter sp.]|nr:L-threonylcarbamoyladenylate synthase [Lysobacter sp.]
MTDVLPPTSAGIARAAELLRGGAVVAFPTDTVYGVAVASRDRLSDLFALKQRPIEKRIPMLVADLSEATGADDRARALADRFWPGALTLVLPGSGESQAFRAPDHPVALALIRATGPIFATSANRSSESCASACQTRSHDRCAAADL